MKSVLPQLCSSISNLFIFLGSPPCPKWKKMKNCQSMCSARCHLLCWKQMKSSEVISSERKRKKKPKIPFFSSWKSIVFVNVLLSLEAFYMKLWDQLEQLHHSHVCSITGSNNRSEPPSSKSFTEHKSFSACIVVTLPRMLTSATVLRIQSTTDSKSTKLKSGCCLSRCSSAAKVSSWFFRMEPVQQWEEFQRVEKDAIQRCADPHQHSGAERLSRQHCLGSGKEHEEEASKYKYQGIRLLLSYCMYSCNIDTCHGSAVVSVKHSNIFYINGCH